MVPSTPKIAIDSHANSALRGVGLQLGVDEGDVHVQTGQVGQHAEPNQQRRN